MASFNNLDDLLNHFEEMECPYFIVSEDKKSIFSMNNKIADIEDAAEKLKKILEHKDHSKIYHIYCFKTISKTGMQIPTKAGNHLLFSYQKARPEYSPEQRANYYGGLGEMIRMQNERMERLENLLTTRNVEENVEDDEDLKENMQQNIIGQVLGNPAVQNIITNLLTNIFANTVTTPNMNHTNMPQYRPTALAGTEEINQAELELAQTLEILFDKGVTLDHLKKLAAMPKVKIQSLLLML